VAFVALPIAGVIGLAAYKFGDSDKKDTTEVAQKPEGPKEPPARKPDPNRPTPRPPTHPDKGHTRPDPIQPIEPPHGVEPGKQPDTAKPEPMKPDPVKPEPVAVAALPVAPEPRAVEAVIPEPLADAPEPRAARLLMAPPPGFTSQWEQAGVVEVRIAGVAFTRVPVTDLDGNVFDSPSPVLAIWLEVRTQSKTRTVELKRWQDSLGSSCQLATRFNEIDRASFGPGRSLRNGLPYKQTLPADGTPCEDMLVFKEPPDGATELRLTLDADRFGETGKVKFTIPSTAWKKK
jgi:hypothetical protein